MILQRVTRLASDTSVRGSSADNSIGGAQARQDATLSLILLAPIPALLVPPGAGGHLFDLTTEMGIGALSNPLAGFDTAPGFPTVFRFLFSLGQGAIHFSAAAQMLGNYGNVMWSLVGEVGLPGSFSQAVPDPPLLSFSFSGNTSNGTDELKIGDKITATAPDVVGLEGRLRLVHDNGVALSINLLDVTETQDYGGNGVLVTA